MMPPVVRLVVCSQHISQCQRHIVTMRTNPQLLSSRLSQCFMNALALLITALFVTMSNSGECSVAAQPPVGQLPAGDDWTVRVIGSSPAVLPQAIMLVVAAGSRIEGLLDLIARQQPGLARDRMQLLFSGRILRNEEVLMNIPRAFDGVTFILHLAAVVVPVAAGAVAGARRAAAAVAPPTLNLADIFDAAIAVQGGLGGIMFTLTQAVGNIGLGDAFGVLTRADCLTMFRRANNGIRRIRLAPPRRRRNPPFPGRAAMKCIRTVAVILTAGHDGICPVQSAGKGAGSLDENKIMAIMGCFHVKGHRSLHDNFVEQIYDQL